MLSATRTALQRLTPLIPSLIPWLLFAASAAFVVWRNSQVGVLVDLAYVVNIATRIALGDVPYRDFPLAQAPGEFVVQALLIKLLGPHYVVQIVYAAIVGGAATVLTYVIARRVLAGAVPSPAGLAAIVTLPLIPLGVYAILPNPFYDSDACLVVLATIAVLLSARDRAGIGRYLLAGALATIPLFIKQNIGGAFLFSLIGVLIIEAWLRPARRDQLRWVGIGIAVSLAVELLVLQLTAGLDAYVRWAWTFAMSGRGVTLGRMREFADPLVLWPAVLIVALVLAARRLPDRARGPFFAAGLTVTLAASLVAPATLLGAPQMVPPLLVAAVTLGLFRAAAEGPSFELLLPLVLAATTLGTLQSQGLASSTFGIFPVLSLAVASVARDIATLVPRPTRLAPLTAAVIALIVTVVGTAYTVENVRLRFIDVNAPGPVAGSTFPALVGLSARGPYLAELDAILFWMRDHVPADESFAFLPGEDPAFFALGRKPALPSVYFYDVATPYTPLELARIADQVGLRWVIVKDRLQLSEVPPLEPELIVRLTDRAALVTTIGPYRVFRR